MTLSGPDSARRPAVVENIFLIDGMVLSSFVAPLQPPIMTIRYKQMLLAHGVVEHMSMVDGFSSIGQLVGIP